MKQSGKYQTFLNPAGFIEQHFIGEQTPDSVIASMNELVRMSKIQKAKKQKVLILACLEEVNKIDISLKMASVRKEAVRTIKDTQFDKAAIYGNSTAKVMINTLALIAGKRDKLRVFGSRVEALTWLKSKK